MSIVRCGILITIMDITTTNLIGQLQKKHSDNKLLKAYSNLESVCKHITSGVCVTQRIKSNRMTQKRSSKVLS